MGSKGGDVDTSGLEDSTRKAQALLQQNYEQTRSDVAPWYDVGVSGVNRLADLLGLSGGSVQTREQVYQDLLPQYTQDVTQQYANQYVDPVTGQVVNVADKGAYVQNYLSGLPDHISGTDEYMRKLQGLGRSDEAFDLLGYDPYSTQTTTTDYTALNAAVDSALANQGVPDDYGTLLEGFSLDKFEEDPGYQYRQEQANKALQQQLAAQGVTLGGAGYGDLNPTAALLLDEQTQNLASQEYQNAYNRYVNDQLNTYNMLSGVSGMGQQATGTMAAAGQGMAQGVSQLGTDLASAQMNAQMAEASQPSMFSTLLGGAATLGGAWAGSPTGASTISGWFSDIRLKEDIKLVGVEMGHNIYEFNYKDGSGRYRGVMAHEVKEIEPDAVIEMPNGYLAVNYDKIGLEMERV